MMRNALKSGSTLANQKGFTLIELIMVIVLLGILAAVAIPRYQDLRTEAAQAACDGVFGAVQGAAAISFAARLVSPSAGTLIVDGPSLVASLEGGAPSGWTQGAGGATTDALSATFGNVICSISISQTQAVNTIARLRNNFTW